MFGRRKKDKEVVGTPCPFCDFVNELGATQCVQCYYEFEKSARDQPMASPTTTNNDIMALLLDDNEEEDEAPVMVEAVLALDDVTVEVDQYAAVETAAVDDEGLTTAAFDYIESAAPALATTVISQPEEEDIELTPKDAPEATVEFQVPDLDPLEAVSEPIHTGQGGLFTTEDAPVESNDDLTGTVGPEPDLTAELPELPDEDGEFLAPPSLAAAVAMEDEPVEIEVPEVPDVPDWPDEHQLNAMSSPVTVPEIPDLPPDGITPTVPMDLNHDEVILPELPDDAEAEVISFADAHTPDIPDLPEETPDLPDLDDPPLAASQTVEQEPTLRMWPWPAGESWSNQQVYQAVIAAMEHVKHGRLPTAAESLDVLGPHLDHHLDMLPHIIAIMVHVGRKEHAEWTVQMAAHLFGDDPHVQQARAQVPR